MVYSVTVSADLYLYVCISIFQWSVVNEDMDMRSAIPNGKSQHAIFSFGYSTPQPLLQSTLPLWFDFDHVLLCKQTMLITGGKVFVKATYGINGQKFHF